ncbi:sialic acid-binding Ig-like lectin 10 [Rhynchocyon petersi]
MVSPTRTHRHELVCGEGPARPRSPQSLPPSAGPNPSPSSAAVQGGPGFLPSRVLDTRAYPHSGPHTQESDSARAEPALRPQPGLLLRGFRLTCPACAQRPAPSRAALSLLPPALPALGPVPSLPPSLSPVLRTTSPAPAADPGLSGSPDNLPLLLGPLPLARLTLDPSKPRSPIPAPPPPLQPDVNPSAASGISEPRRPLRRVDPGRLHRRSQASPGPTSFLPQGPRNPSPGPLFYQDPESPCPAPPPLLSRTRQAGPAPSLGTRDPEGPRPQAADSPIPRLPRRRHRRLRGRAPDPPPLHPSPRLRRPRPLRFLRAPRRLASPLCGRALPPGPRPPPPCPALARLQGKKFHPALEGGGARAGRPGSVTQRRGKGQKRGREVAGGRPALGGPPSSPAGLEPGARALASAPPPSSPRRAPPLHLCSLRLRGSLQEHPGYRLELPESVTVQEGLCVTVPCTFSYPWENWYTPATLYISWFWNGDDVYYDFPVLTTKPHQSTKDTNGRFQLRGNPQSSNCSLSISDTRKSDTGTYFFRVERGSNVKYNYRDKKLNLHVTDLTEKPAIHILEPLTSGHPTKLTCSLPGSCEEERLLTFSWKGDALTMLGSGALTSSELILTPRLQDQGTNLTCQVKLRRSQIITERTIRLNVSYAPENLSINIPSQNGTGSPLCCPCSGTVQEGSGPLIRTLVRGALIGAGFLLTYGLTWLYYTSYPWENWYTPATLYISWFWNGDDVYYDFPVLTTKPHQSTKDTNGRFQLRGNPHSNSCSLSISDARKSDMGTYFFRVERGKSTPRSILTSDLRPYLSIPDAPENLSIKIFKNGTAFQVMGNVSSLSIQEGQSLRLVCVADSNPPAVLSWFQGSLALNGSNITKTGDLELLKVRTENEGEFTCRAQNLLGSQNISVNLSVLYSLQLLEPSCSWEDKGLLCTCSAQAWPLPSLRWWIGTGLVDGNSSNASFSVTSSSTGPSVNSSLRLHKDLSNVLRLCCEASNDHGKQSITVLVLPG